MIGRTVGRYRIVEKLGEGGMGSVWKAEDPLLRRTVAIKLLASALWASNEARERFLREARAVSRLEHPGIATVYDFGEFEGSPFIAFQFVDGQSFSQLVESGPLEPREAFGLAAAAAEALAHAHGRGVLHRDVSANNLMLADDGRVVVVDFGLALPEGQTRVTRSVVSVGTVGYMAPELFRGEAASERSDAYGLGAVLYRLLTGKLPHEASTLEASIYRMLHDPLAPPSDVRLGVPKICDSVVMRALEREPHERLSGAAEFAAELRAVEALLASTPRLGAVSGEVTQSVRIRRGDSTREAGSRRRFRAVWGWSSAAAPIVVLAGLWLWRQVLPRLGAETVVAVLPLRVSGDVPQEIAQLPDAIGDQLADRLGALRGLRVVPWTTSRAYPAFSRDSRVISRDLTARYLIRGTVEPDSDQVRVSAAILDGPANRTLATFVLTGLPEEVLALESNLANEIAARLRGNLSKADRAQLASAPTTSTQAYEFFIRGSYYVASDNPTTKALAERFFRKALDLDPKYTDAWVALGALADDKFFRGEPGGATNLQVAERDFRRALQLDPHKLRAIQGLVLVCWKDGEAEEALRLALQAGPRNSRDVEVLLIHGMADMLCGLPDRAVEELNRAISIDPENQAAHWYRVVALSWAGDPDGCIQAGRDFTKRFGEDPEILTWIGVSYTCKAMYAEARHYYERAMRLFGEGTDLYVIPLAAFTEFVAGDSAAGRGIAAQWLPELSRRVAQSPDNYRPLEGAMILNCLLGNKADAIRQADLMCAALEKHQPGTGDMTWWPALCFLGDRALVVRNLRAQTRFNTATTGILTRAGTDRVFFPKDDRNPQLWPEYLDYARAVREQSAALRRTY